MRARTRAVAAAAGAALIVVPLTGAAAAALVTAPETALTPDQDVVAAANLSIANDIAEVPEVVAAEDDAKFEVDTPSIKVKENPKPKVTVPTTSSSSSGATRATGVTQPSAAVSQAIAGSAVIAYAAKFVGTPYVSGGSSPSGFDCSGFVSYVYKHFGISLPRSSGAYYSVGTRVSSPLPGDIIVSPGHVGLYAGKNLQIDSPRPGKTIQFRAIWQSNPVFVRVS